MISDRLVRLPLTIPLLVSALLVLAGAGIVFGREKDVTGTPHDVATPGNPPCVSCHIPRDSGGQVLWSNDPRDDSGFSGLKPLCFSCHDGTVTTVGTYAFDTTRSEHPRTPSVKQKDCDLCHDPHEEGAGKFVKVDGGADLCRECHERAGPSDHPVDVDTRPKGIVPRDATWDAAQGDFTGTRLFDPSGTGPGYEVKCLSCHAPHGGEPDTSINTIELGGSHTPFMTLCQNCHYGWSN